MANMTWIFSRRAVPVYRSDWTDARSAETAIEYLLEVRQRWSQALLAPFRIKRLEFGDTDQGAFYSGQARSGLKAVRECRAAWKALRSN